MTTLNGRVYGHIEGCRVGTLFPSKEALGKAGVHVQRQAGIHGDPNANGGAFSICLSEGYEDNVDNGNTMYTYYYDHTETPSLKARVGGQDANGDQREDQSFEHPPNKSLLVGSALTTYECANVLQISSETKRPVRVVRGKNTNNHYAPKSGYRYDGLYVVDDASMKVGKKGFKMCTFLLRRIEEEGVGPVPTRRTLDVKKLLKMSRASKRGI
ncbi:hypothetical protein PAXINDRAFT_156151 [Paxillus involutus ATCC 200175]|uniref:YDG domain-containing protein n=1 Tax=Paxillus involutus ATCC 200175 TaxID=664439 RepID=A0A0C9U4W5_PAXIN|nr:hypothetical protein PAXINDRAFT_156151 [Paxillus involutus ATCC 200175]